MSAIAGLRPIFVKGDFDAKIIWDQIEITKKHYKIDFCTPYILTEWNKLKETTTVEKDFPIRFAIIEAYLEAVKNLPVYDLYDA